MAGQAGAGAAKSLDIPELQMLVEFPGDENGLDFHHRILWYRVQGSEWIVSTPDFDVYEEDYAGTTVVPLTRNAGYPPGYAGQLYVPNNACLMQQYADLRRQADHLALVRGCQDRPGVTGDGPASAQVGDWRVSDVDSEHFGIIVPPHELNDPALNTLLDVNGLQRRLHFKDGKILALELVVDYEKWNEKKRPGVPGGHAGDLRILGCSRDSAGKRGLSLVEALRSMTPSDFADWPHRGPRAAKEFLESVVEAGGDLQIYQATFFRKSGLSDYCAAAHEFKNLMLILRLSLSYDQVDGSNLASIEQVVRRLLDIQTAVRRNPKHPVFDSFDYQTRGTVDEVGGARAPSFGEWMAEQQKIEAKTLKATREWRTEQTAERKSAPSARAGKDDASSGEDEDPARKKKKKKKKPDKGGGAQNPAPTS